MQQVIVPSQVIRVLERTETNSIDHTKINKSVFKPSFWDSAPMKRNNQEKNQIISLDYAPDSISEPELPTGYEWVDFDPHCEADLVAMTEFLNKHYQKFDKEYKREYVKWILTSPTYSQYKRLENVPMSTRCVGVRASTNGAVVGLITARPVMYKIDAKYIQTFTVDFLCTHKQLRKNAFHRY